MTNETTSNQQRLVVKLEENAMDSLVHGVEHHLYGRRNTDWKYVILHVFHAVELFLKARLAKHDESFIYKNRKSGNTVGSNVRSHTFPFCKSGRKKLRFLAILLG
ncbi:hypothetical protein [uncultured Nostoc sp.]|uniref:hypothetical protein n=1 Tax=uncultured Nostoc sp. TaxID=340711 RepID=UPI0035CB8B28